jgi:anti-sigma factor RsiW
MHCPACGVPYAETDLECPACHLIFAKWRARQERASEAAASPSPGTAPAGSVVKEKAPRKPFFPGWESLRHPRTPEERFLRWTLYFAAAGVLVFLIGLALSPSAPAPEAPPLP